MLFPPRHRSRERRGFTFLKTEIFTGKLRHGYKRRVGRICVSRSLHAPSVRFSSLGVVFVFFFFFGVFFSLLVVDDFDSFGALLDRLFFSCAISNEVNSRLSTSLSFVNVQLSMTDFGEPSVDIHVRLTKMKMIRLCCLIKESRAYNSDRAFFSPCAVPITLPSFAFITHPTKFNDCAFSNVCFLKNTP